jgi:hypothetical protein
MHAVLRRHLEADGFGDISPAAWLLVLLVLDPGPPDLELIDDRLALGQLAPPCRRGRCAVELAHLRTSGAANRIGLHRRRGAHRHIRNVRNAAAPHAVGGLEVPRAARRFLRGRSIRKANRLSGSGNPRRGDAS